MNHSCASCILVLLVALNSYSAEVTTIVGTGTKGFSGDGGQAKSAQLNNPFAVVRGPDDALYVCDVDNDRIRRIDQQGIITTVAGNGQRGYSGDGGLATDASLNQPYEIAWDKSQNMYFVEIGNHVVRKIDAQTRIILTVAGIGKPGFAGDDGPANQSMLNQPHSLAFDQDEMLYVCDILNHRIRQINIKGNVIKTWSGTGEKTTSPDATSISNAALFGPRAMAFDAEGNMWLALREGNALLKLDLSSGTIKRMAGTGKSGFTGNGGPALAATLAGPKCVSLDAQGNVYMADTESHSIRMYDIKKETIEVIVGDGKKGDGPDGTDLLKCQLARPHGVYIDKDGSILIGDSENHRVRRVQF